MKKVLIIFTLLIAVLGSSAFAVNLTDIKGHWAELYIQNLVNVGIVNGYEDGTYRPEGPIKKGEFIKLMMVASLPNENFVNVHRYKHWSSPYLECAEDYSILKKGEINDRNADEPITRAEVVEILGKCDIQLKKTEQEVSSLTFTDIDGLTDMQYVMLAHCFIYGYIEGYQDNTFGPGRTLTRAEVATILYRYYYHENGAGYGT